MNLLHQAKPLVKTSDDGVLATQANLTASYGAFHLMSCDLHPAILWKTERERERLEGEREPHNSHTNLVLSELAEVRQQKFNTLAENNAYIR